MGIKEIKAKLSLIEASTLTNKVLVEGYQDCPFCKEKNKLRVKNNLYNCFHPACNEHGGLWEYVEKFGNYSSSTEIYKALNKKAGLYKSTEDWLKSIKTMTKAFDIYKSNYGIESTEFLISRGYKRIDSVHKIRNVGYAPVDKPLQKAGMDFDELYRVGLVYKNGEEYYSNRVIFPVRDGKGRTVHMCGRDLNKESELRWKSTKTPDDGSLNPIHTYLYNKDEVIKSYTNTKTLVICEGITDVESILELGLPCVGSFGINIDLTNHIDLFEKFNILVVLYDSDRFSIGNPLEGQYKSWSRMVYSLKELQIKLPNLKIVCCPPPNIGRVKDVNDWYKEGLTKDILTNYVKSNGTLLTKFCFNEFGNKLEYQKLLLELVSLSPTKTNIKFMQTSINQIGNNNAVNYLLKTKCFI
jgi:ribosomal protein L37AE/L43A